jgi:hypothetical protein
MVISRNMFQIMFQGIPVDLSDPSRLYRGFIAVDKIQQSSGSYCRGFCSFAAGFCDWGNEQGDDFDWALVSLLVFLFPRVTTGRSVILTEFVNGFMTPCRILWLCPEGRDGFVKN